MRVQYSLGPNITLPYTRTTKAPHDYYTVVWVRYTTSTMTQETSHERGPRALVYSVRCTYVDVVGCQKIPKTCAGFLQFQKRFELMWNTRLRKFIPEATSPLLSVANSQCVV